jgi:hypothetical protein
MPKGTAAARLVLLQDTGTGRGMALAPMWRRALLRRSAADARRPRDCSSEARRGTGWRARQWPRGGLGTPPSRRCAAPGGAHGAGSFVKPHPPSSALVKKRPSFRRGHTYSSGCAARRCATTEQGRCGRCARRVITWWSSRDGGARR